MHGHVRMPATTKHAHGTRSRTLHSGVLSAILSEGGTIEAFAAECKASGLPTEVKRMLPYQPLALKEEVCPDALSAPYDLLPPAAVTPRARRSRASFGGGGCVLGAPALHVQLHPNSEGPEGEGAGRIRSMDAAPTGGPCSDTRPQQPPGLF